MIKTLPTNTNQFPTIGICSASHPDPNSEHLKKTALPSPAIGAWKIARRRSGGKPTGPARPWISTGRRAKQAPRPDTSRPRQKSRQALRGEKGLSRRNGTAHASPGMRKKARLNCAARGRFMRRGFLRSPGWANRADLLPLFARISALFCPLPLPARWAAARAGVADRGITFVSRRDTGTG